MRKWLLTGLILATVSLSSSNSDTKKLKKMRRPQQYEVRVDNADIVIKKLNNLTNLIDTLNSHRK